MRHHPRPPYARLSTSRGALSCCAWRGFPRQSVRACASQRAKRPGRAFGFVRRRREILERLTPEQMNRYECFRRSALSRPNVKRVRASVHVEARVHQQTIDSHPRASRLTIPCPAPAQIMQGMVNTTVTQPMAIVMAGIAKLYVGDLVEGGAFGPARGNSFLFTTTTRLVEPHASGYAVGV